MLLNVARCDGQTVMTDPRVEQQRLQAEIEVIRRGERHRTAVHGRVLRQERNECLTECGKNDSSCLMKHDCWFVTHSPGPIQRGT